MVTIVPLHATPETVASLAAMIVEAVADGSSVSFMHPLARQDAEDFWTRSLNAAEDGRRVVLGAIEAGEIVGTVTLDLDTPPNQPHRADVAKLITRKDRRKRGIGTALMHEVEQVARARGRTLLTLDSATKDGAGPLYERLGFTRVGVIPDYALTPFGEWSGTILYFKRIDPLPG
jgi:GNAT superfamily N-acetyltransferase